MLVAIITLSISTSVFAQTEEIYAEVDRKMIRLLALNEAQASAYREVISQQRQLFLKLDAADWQQELALYRETFALLRPVLTEQQHARFVGIINSVIETPGDDYRLASGN